MDKVNETMKDKKCGILIISLDFELLWGIVGRGDPGRYKDNVLGGREAIPEILKLFQKYKIHATWATVGLLMLSSKDYISDYLPRKIPGYKNKALSPYSGYIDKIGKDENEDKLHFGLTLLKIIKSFANQEIGSHTFSHYCCLADGQTNEEFREDLVAWQNIAKRDGIEMRSLVFPGNQCNGDYLETCSELGIKSFRGNPDYWPYRAINEKNPSIIIRLARLMDSYFNLWGNSSYSKESVKKRNLVNIKASRFLYWYNSKLKFLEPLRLRRIKKELNYAAKNGLIFHLWWHPHNFGLKTEENLIFLEKVLRCYQDQKNKYGMLSLNMNEAAELLSKYNYNNR